jgi:hypothetical protein
VPDSIYNTLRQRKLRCFLELLFKARIRFHLLQVVRATRKSGCLRGAHPPRMSQSAPSPTAHFFGRTLKGHEDVVGGGADHDRRGARAPQNTANPRFAFRFLNSACSATLRKNPVHERCSRRVAEVAEKSKTVGPGGNSYGQNLKYWASQNQNNARAARCAGCSALPMEFREGRAPRAP